MEWLIAIAIGAGLLASGIGIGLLLDRQQLRRQRLYSFELRYRALVAAADHDDPAVSKPTNKALRHLDEMAQDALAQYHHARTK